MFPGRTSVTSATAAPAAAKRPSVGATDARVKSSAQRAKAAAITSSLPNSWNIAA